MTQQGQQIYGQTALSELGGAQNALSQPINGSYYQNNANAGLNTLNFYNQNPLTTETAPYVNGTNAAFNTAMGLTANPLNGAPYTSATNAALDQMRGAAQPVDTGTASKVANAGLNDALVTANNPFNPGGYANAANSAVNEAQSIAAHPMNQNFDQYTQNAMNAALSRIAPEQQMQNQALQSQLLAQGITPGSEAWNNSFRQFNQGQNDLLLQATAQAPNYATTAIQQQESLRNQGLNEAQNVLSDAGTAMNQDMASRNQYLNEGSQLLQDANQAQQQQFNAQNQNLNAAATLMQGSNAAQQQQFGLRNQDLNESSQLLNTSGNAIQQQLGLRNEAVNNAQAVLNGAGSGLQQNIALRDQPINEASALLSGSQVQMPNLTPVNPQAQMANTDVLGAYNAQYQGQLNAYNAQLQNQSARMGGLYGMLGTGATAGAMAFSDERMKQDVRRVGETDQGTPIYTYRFHGSPQTQMGVLAQELLHKQPGAVKQTPSGMYAVDYSRVS